MESTIKTYIVTIRICTILCFLAICACSPSQEHKDLQAEHDILLIEFETENDLIRKQELLVELLNIEIMGMEDLDSALAHYNEHEALLEESVLGRSLAATAQAMKAGKENEIRDKLKWLSLSSGHFEELHQKWPDNIIVHVYHASTLASLPPEVGARDEAIGLVENLFTQEGKKDTSLLRDYERQLGYIIKNLLQTPGSKDGDERLKETQDKYKTLFTDRSVGTPGVPVE